MVENETKREVRADSKVSGTWSAFRIRISDKCPDSINQIPILQNGSESEKNMSHCDKQTNSSKCKLQHLCQAWKEK